MRNFKEHYEEIIVPKLSTEVYKNNPMRVPKILKVVINVGVASEVINDSKVIEEVSNQLQRIAGQRPVVTHVRKSIAAFKLREGAPAGCKVELRKRTMFWFLEKLIFIVFLELTDFDGFSINNFDGKGNLNFGLKTQIVFPEVNYDMVNKIRGMNITIVTSAKTDEEAKELLKQFYFPFRD